MTEGTEGYQAAQDLHDLGLPWNQIKVLAKIHCRGTGETYDNQIRVISRQLGADATKCIFLEKDAPWEELERRLLERDEFPILSKDEDGIKLREQSRLWLDLLSKMPSDRGERDLRLYLTAITVTNTGTQLVGYMRKILYSYDYLLKRRRFVVMPGRCFASMEKQRWHFAAIASWEGVVGDHGPMGEGNNGPVRAKGNLLLIARQLGIVLPKRLKD